MRILAVQGSARRNGNSDTVLAQALEGIRQEAPDAEIETLTAYGLPITACRSCNGCWNTGTCVVQDAMQDLYAKFYAADHVVLAAPIYMASLPGHLKVLIDRFQCSWVRTFRLGNPPQPRRTGMFLCVGAMDREKYYRNALSIVRAWMAMLNMGCEVSRFYPGLDERKAVRARDNYLQDAREAGVKLMRLSRPADSG